MKRNGNIYLQVTKDDIIGFLKIDTEIIFQFNDINFVILSKFVDNTNTLQFNVNEAGEDKIISEYKILDVINSYLVVNEDIKVLIDNADYHSLCDCIPTFKEEIKYKCVSINYDKSIQKYTIRYKDSETGLPNVYFYYQQSKNLIVAERETIKSIVSQKLTSINVLICG